MKLKLPLLKFSTLIFWTALFVILMFDRTKVSNLQQSTSIRELILSQQPPWAVTHCTSTMKALYEQKSATQWLPPCPLSEVSESLRSMYQQNGLPNRDTVCFVQRYEGAHVMNWSTSYIDSY